MSDRGIIDCEICNSTSIGTIQTKNRIVDGFRDGWMEWIIEFGEVKRVPCGANDRNTHNIETTQS